MPAKLNDKGITRIIKVYGVEAPVAVHFDENGIFFKIAGRGGKPVSAPWQTVVKACATADNARCYDAGDPLGYLQREAQKRTKKAAKVAND